MKIKVKFLTIFIFVSLFFACGKSDKTYLTKYKLAKKFYLNKNLEKAIFYLKKTLELKKDYQPALILLGKSYYYSGDKKQAKKTFHKLLELNPNSIDALTWLVRIEGIDENNKQKGLFYCEKILKIDSNNYLAHLFKGMIYDSENKTKEAIIEYTTALQLEKIIYLAHIQLGNLYARKGLNDKAVEHFKKALLYEISPAEKLKLQRRIKEYEK